MQCKRQEHEGEERTMHAMRRGVYWKRKEEKTTRRRIEERNSGMERISIHSVESREEKKKRKGEGRRLTFIKSQ